MLIDEEVKQKLDSVGIELNCESPLEISHPEYEAFASGYFAETVIEQIMNGDYDEPLDIEETLKIYHR